MTISIRQVMARRIVLALWALGALSCTEGTAPVPPQPLLGVAISQRLKNLAVGDTNRIRFQMYDSSYTEVPLVRGERSVQYSVGDSSVASISADGLVTARRVGTTAVVVTIDSRLSSGSEPVAVVQPPQQVVLVATGDGDIDLRWFSTCNLRPSGIPAFGGRYLPTECYTGVCQVRGGRATASCVYDATGSKPTLRYDLGIKVPRDSTVDVQFLNRAGQPVPPTAGATSCDGLKCLLAYFVLKSDTIRVSVTKR